MPKQEEIKSFGDLNILENLNVTSDEAVKKYEMQLEEERQQLLKEKLEENYKKTSGVPKRYLNESLETYRPTEENNRVFSWIKGFVDAVIQKKNQTNIIYLSGKFGTGKTHLGCGVIRKLGGKIITSLALCITYDSCRDFKSDMTRIQFLHKLCESPVLVIDEVGKGITQIEKEILPFIVNEFYGSGNILIFLGNEDKTNFNELIGEAGVDRMAEVGAYFTLIGESNRTRK